MTERVGVELEVQNRLRFAREMAASTRDVDQFGDEVGQIGPKAAASTTWLSRLSHVGRGLRSNLQASVAPSRSLALGLGLGAGGVAFAAHRGWQELVELNKVQQITRAHLESTGKAAGVSARHVRRQSMALEELTSIDENLIGRGQNLLLTFRNVRNEQGAGNKIFDRGIRGAADLSIEFGSVTSTSKMLGKALNDPVRGMTALTRAGVTFSDEQKTMVERMIENNDILGAQKLILREVEGQVGGTAAKYGDSIEGMGNRVDDAFGDLSRSLTRGFLPVVERVMEPTTEWLQEVTGIVEKRGWRAAWEEVVPKEIRDNVDSIAGAISGGLVPAVAAFAGKIALSTLRLAPFLVMGSAVADMLGVQVEKSDRLGDSMKKKLGPGVGDALEKLSALGREINDLSPGKKFALGTGLLVGGPVARSAGRSLWSSVFGQAATGAGGAAVARGGAGLLGRLAGGAAGGGAAGAAGAIPVIGTAAVIGAGTGLVVGRTMASEIKQEEDRRQHLEETIGTIWHLNEAQAKGRITSGEFTRGIRDTLRWAGSLTDSVGMWDKSLDSLMDTVRLNANHALEEHAERLKDVKDGFEAWGDAARPNLGNVKDGFMKVNSEVGRLNSRLDRSLGLLGQLRDVPFEDTTAKVGWGRTQSGRARHGHPSPGSRGPRSFFDHTLPVPRSVEMDGGVPIRLHSTTETIVNLDGREVARSTVTKVQDRAARK